LNKKSFDLKNGVNVLKKRKISVRRELINDFSAVQPDSSCCSDYAVYSRRKEGIMAGNVNTGAQKYRLQ
jgi:hypothetical protein